MRIEPMKVLFHSFFQLLIFLAVAFPAFASQNPIGEVQTLRGTAVAVDGGQKRMLAAGDKLFRSETVATGAESFLQVMFEDGTVLALDAHTEMILNDVAYEPGNSDNRIFDIDMVAGTCRFVTGQITKHSPDKFKIGSPLGTIGIRGTEGGVSAPADNAAEYGAGLDAAMGAPGSGWNPGPRPGVSKETVAHINGSTRRPMSFTDTFGKTVEIGRGQAVDVSAGTGAGAPRGISAQDRQTFSPADFSTSANVPSAYTPNFSGYSASPGLSGGVLGGGTGDGSAGAVGGGETGGGAHP
jgi:hypothetical protein